MGQMNMRPAARAAAAVAGRRRRVILVGSAAALLLALILVTATRVFRHRPGGARAGAAATDEPVSTTAPGSADAGGDVVRVIAWSRERVLASGAPEVCFLRHADDGGGEWHSDIVKQVDVNTKGAWLVLDSRGRPHVFYVQQHTIRHAQRHGAGWVSEALVAAARPPIACAAGPDDALHLSYADRRGALFTATSKDGWKPHAVGAGRRPSLRCSREGVVHVAWQGAGDRIRYACSNDWARVEEVLAVPGHAPSLALRPGGQPVVAVSARARDGRMSVFTRRSGKWAEIAGWSLSPREDPEGIEAADCAAASDAAGTVHVAWSDRTPGGPAWPDRVRYATSRDWSAVRDLADVSWAFALAAGPDAVHFAGWTAAPCIIDRGLVHGRYGEADGLQTVWLGGDWWPGLDVDAGGRAHLAWTSRDRLVVSVGQLRGAARDHVAPRIDVVLGGGVTFEMVYVPAGTFVMGDRAVADNPPHTVRLLKSLYVAACPVTVRQYAVFAERTGRRSARLMSTPDGGVRPGWRAPGFEQEPSEPVVMVSWHDAGAFCRWLSDETGRTVRLPTEAEWEYCCRAGRGGGAARFPWGRAWPPTDGIGNYAAAHHQALYGNRVKAISGYLDEHVFTAPVAGYPCNPWWLHDMGHNVSQWCADRYAEKTCAVDCTDPRGPAQGEERVRRGGSWQTSTLPAALTARRGHAPPATVDSTTGFRVVCEIEAAGPSAD